MSTESVKNMTYIERGDYYQNKTFCRLDTDVLTWKDIPITHPAIAFRLFLNDIRDRNRLQNNLREIEKVKDYKWARTIHPYNFFTYEDIVEDVKQRIRKLEIKIEAFHSKYNI